MTSGLTLRFFIDGQLVDEQLVTDLETGNRVAEDHEARASAAEANGQVWLAEIEDPDGPADSRCVRFGTDLDRMTNPVATVNNLVEQIEQLPLAQRLRKEALGS